MKVISYKPLDIHFHTWLANWDEAWQRVTLYNMTEHFDRVFHFDVDAYVFDNVDDILETREVPSVARRMGGCSHPEKICSTQPVSNFMLISPDQTIWNKVTEKLDKLNADVNLKKAPDETLQFNYHEKIHLLPPSDAIYSDCFWNQNSKQLSEYGLDADHIPRIVHLGRAGKIMLDNMLKNPEALRARLERQEQAMALKVLDKAEALQARDDVQAMLKVLAENAKEETTKDFARIASKEQYTDVCN